mgnify:CR=1 FL=1
MAPHMEAVARQLLGEPNRALSSPLELRWGSRGSLSADLKKGTFFDHERGEGGGVLDLIARETGLRGREAVEWMRERGFDVSDGPACAAPAKGPGGKTIVAEYDYRDEAGDLLFQVVRLEPKDFRQRRRDAVGGWSWSIKGVRRVLYRLPELADAPAGATVFLVEGEKDADRLAELGLLATTPPGGAGKWRAEYAPQLRDLRVVILPDADAPGAEHADAVRASLAAEGIEAAVLHLDGLPDKGDVSDWLDAGGKTDELLRRADAALDAPAPLGRRAEALRARLVSAADMRPRLELDYLIKGWLDRHGVSVLYGPSNTGKSFLALDLAHHVAKGRPWGQARVRRGRVLYLALEGGGRIANRVAALDAPEFDILCAPLALAGQDNDAPALAELLNAAERDGGPYDLIVVDTLARAMAGADENTAVDISTLIASVESIQAACGAHCMLLHHPGKDLGRGSRGHSSLRAAIDTEIVVSRDDDTGVVTAKLDKSRDGPTGAAFTFRLEQVDLGEDQDGDPVTTCRVQPCDPDAAPVRSKAAERALLIFERLRDVGGGGDVPVPEWRKACRAEGLSTSGTGDAEKRAFQRARDALLAEGIVRIDGDKVWSVEDANG